MSRATGGRLEKKNDDEEKKRQKGRLQLHQFGLSKSKKPKQQEKKERRAPGSPPPEEQFFCLSASVMFDQAEEGIGI
jgi:hypothetical protein